MEYLVAAFPVIFLLAFFWALHSLLLGRPEGVLGFIIFALPLYQTSLSVIFLFGFGSVVPLLQGTKELLVLLALAVVVWQQQRRFRPNFIDWMMMAYLAWGLLYLLLPSGFSFREKLVALKGIAFFPLLYFIGRLIDPARVNIKRWLYYVCVVTIAAGAMVAFEVLDDEHLQQHTGYADFNFYFFNVDPAGHYDLTWTFESGSGHKRFASFYSMPLEHAAATLVSVSALFALSLRRWGQYRFAPFLQLAAVATLLSIVFALSRAAFLGYFIMLYVYTIAAGKRRWLNWIHGGGIAIALVWFVWIRGDIYTWVLETVQFTDSSSVSHLVEWLDGINAIRGNPMGLGLGSSGRVAGSLGENVGGENQLIIIGVQLGLVGMALYGILYIAICKEAIAAFRAGDTRSARLGLLLFLSKVGLIIPLLTSEIETYIYISYLVWFCSGFLVNLRTNYERSAAALPAFGY